MDAIEQALAVALARFEQPRPEFDPGRFKLRDGAGRLLYCRLCGRCDRWRKENAAVWVCEHRPEPLVRIRNVDSVKHSLIGFCIRQVT